MLSFEECIDKAMKLLENSSIITIMDLGRPGIREGLYYIMEIYGLGFSQYVRADWEWISLKKGENGKPLTAKDILAMDKDEKKYNNLKRNHKNFDSGTTDKEIDQTLRTKVQPFGWLSPDGFFIESEWGTHTESANNIIKEKGFKAEFRSWFKDEPDYSLLAGDFLTQQKGYCLIHSPANVGYIVTHFKPLTKKQKDFLFGYFAEMGNFGRASMYVEE